MQLNEKTAVVDTDFLLKLSESNLSYDKKTSIAKLIEVVEAIFSDLDLNVVVHPLVHQNELISPNECICELFAKRLIERASFDDILQGDSEKTAYYTYLVMELYHLINGVSFPFEESAVLYKWCSGKSLGEVHSLSMCLVCKCGLFLSDDADSKKIEVIIRDNFGGCVKVYKRKELIVQHSNAKKTSLSRSIRQSLSHA